MPITVEREMDGVVLVWRYGPVSTRSKREDRPRKDDAGVLIHLLVLTRRLIEVSERQRPITLRLCVFHGGLHLEQFESEKGLQVHLEKQSIFLF